MVLMVSLQHNDTEESVFIRNFKEVQKKAYSHGLEAIYKLENVDIRSVRALESPLKEAPRKDLIKPDFYLAENDQLDFDFGPKFRNWIPPFFHNEPIQVLGLSRHAEKCLLDHGKHLLRHLINLDIKQFVFLKGMGQGHIEEIKDKLKSYIADRRTDRAFRIDFSGWIRSLSSIPISKKKIFVCMDLYHFSHLFPLPPAELAEIRRLSVEQKSYWIQECLMELLTEQKRMSIIQNLSAISDVFIKPWVHGRLGFATQDELSERIERLSEDQEAAKNAMQFFSEIYFEKQFPLKSILCQAEENIYCLNENIKKLYLIVINLAKTYFYKSTVSYTLSELKTLITREAALYWIGFAEGFIEKVLRNSSHFIVRKQNSGKLEVFSATTIK